jgi:outer membrane protein OmpA-like peptidoglycan-associated protein
MMTLFGACASVPKDAPEELHAADSSIKAADKADADDIVPKTMKAAKKKLDGAVDLYKDGKKKHDNSMVDEAKRNALEAKTMADNAAALNSEVKAADGGDLQAFVDQKQAVSDLADAKAALQQQRNRPAEAPAQASFDVTEAVAFFPTAGAELNDSMAPSLSRFVSVLKSNPNTTIHLTGRADHRGSDQFNETLSQNRVKAVADYLQSQGIVAERITTDAIGKSQAADVNDPGRLQLDRRVDAEVATMAH